jgi:hypothetical protein
MSEFILPASLFSGEPVERDVVLNQVAIDAAEAERDELLEECPNDILAADAIEIPEPKTITFLLLPVPSAIDVEYKKKCGHNVQRLLFTPKKGKSGKPETDIEPIERIISNDQELKAITWIAKKVIKGWRTFKNSEGQDVVFSEHNLEKLCEYSQLIEPAVREAYEIASIKDEAEAGNSETSFVGSASPSEDPNGLHTGEAAEITK